MRILSSELDKYVGQTVRISGWVHRIRELGGVSFIIVRDRMGMVQIVTNQDTIIQSKIKSESVLSVQGTVEKNEKAPQGVELHDPIIELLSSPIGDLPITINAPMDSIGLDTLLNNRLLSLRIPKMRAIFEVQSVILQAYSEYLISQDFTEIKTSKLIHSGTEGGTGLFEVEYFDTKVYLAQSPQLYKQAGMASGLERVFEIGAAYRAEKHETNRHLNEYISLDLEMGFIESVDELIDLEVKIMEHVSLALQEKCETQFQEWGAAIPDPSSFRNTPRITYEEAKSIASKESGTKILEIDPNAEKILSVWAKKECGVSAVFITAFPRRKRPFYTMPDKTGQKTESFDFVCNGVEITSGGLRVHHYNELLENAKKHNMNPNTLEDYLSIFKYGCPPHGGFAIGLERLTQKLLDINNVKLASMFPRDRNRTTP